MEKSKIKAILRENILKSLGEAEQNSDNHKKNYDIVQKKLANTILKQSQVMAAANLGNADSATDRSLFSKKLRRDTNDQGGRYSFDDNELAAIMKILDNPTNFSSK